MPPAFLPAAPLPSPLPLPARPPPRAAPPRMSSRPDARAPLPAAPAAPRAAWPDRALADHAPAHARPTPHAGSYFARRRPRSSFFEGWYLRLVSAGGGRSYAFMFSVEATGPGTVQLLPPDDTLHVCEFAPSSDRFYGHPSELAIAHWGYASAAAGDARPLSPRQFDAAVMQGYQLTDSDSHGRFKSQKGAVVQWAIDFEPTLAWGRRGSAVTTATWLSRLPVFEPGYQVLIAQGVVHGGYVSVDGVKEDLQGAVVYCEKNWGNAFPKRWWWVQAGVPDLAVTAVGSTRLTLGKEEVVGILAVHFDGRLYEFANCTLAILLLRVLWRAWASQAGCSILTLFMYIYFFVCCVAFHREQREPVVAGVPLGKLDSLGDVVQRVQRAARGRDGRGARRRAGTMRRRHAVHRA